MVPNYSVSNTAICLPAFEEMNSPVANIYSKFYLESTNEFYFGLENIIVSSPVCTKVGFYLS